MSYYLMHRGWREHRLFKDQVYSEAEAWEYLIANANYAPSVFRRAYNLYEIPRGDIATSHRALAEKWKWSTGKVIRFLKLLQSDNMIIVKTEHNFLQVSLVNYEVYQNPHQENETETKQERNQLGYRNETNLDTNLKKINKIKEGQRKEYTSDFESLWNLYPRKDGSKAKAFSIYQSAIESGVDHGRIESGVIAYANSVRGKETQYIAHCTTWLNGKRWESDYTIEKPIFAKPSQDQSKSDRAREAVLRGVAIAQQSFAQ